MDSHGFSGAVSSRLRVFSLRRAPLEGPCLGEAVLALNMEGA